MKPVAQTKRLTHVSLTNPNTNMFNHTFDPNLVRPLATAENQFLQVLVDRFRIQRKGKGFELHVTFGEESPSIWLREAKRHILDKLPRERRAALQGDIDAFFASNQETFPYCDASFPFRLGNGGTLPVVRLKGVDYYCLFYRDRHPTGWNIANGGANTRHDLLHPDLIIERELREELIIVEPERRRWYVFDWHDARLHDHPDFAVAQMLWAEQFRRQGFSDFKEVPLPLKWSLPPDAELPDLEHRHYDAMRITCGKEAPVFTGRGFLNINAEDFGIEFDRIAKLSVGPEAVFCDGELRNSRLLNRVVGLFAVNRVQEMVVAGADHFRPDRVFWDGVDRTDEDAKDVIKDYLEWRGSSWEQLEKEATKDAAPNPAPDALDLCPVTRTIVQRHRQLGAAEQAGPAVPAGRSFEVFISFASEDRVLARRVYDEITTSKRRAFFSDVTMTSGGFADQIDVALDSTSAFVAVGSRAEYLQKSWVKYEWRNFHNDIAGGRKPKDAPFFAFVTGVSRQDLPRPLRLSQSVKMDPENPTPAFEQLNKFIMHPELTVREPEAFD
jgi:hypothetical protein